MNHLWELDLRDSESAMTLDLGSTLRGHFKVTKVKMERSVLQRLLLVHGAYRQQDAQLLLGWTALFVTSTWPSHGHSRSGISTPSD